MVKYSGFRIRKTSKFYNAKSKNKSFKKYINKKKSARAQQNQIRILNKKINKVYNVTKPEIKTIQGRAEYDMRVVYNTSTPGGGTYDAGVLCPYNSESGNPEGINFNGNYARYIYANLRFLFNSGSVDLTRAFTARLIVIQNRFNQYDQTDQRLAIPDISEIMDGYSNSVGEIRYNVFTRFKENVTQKYKILYNKFIRINSNVDSKLISINLKNKMLGLRKIENEDYRQARGYIFWYILYPGTTFNSQESYGRIGDIGLNWQLGYIDN